MGISWNDRASIYKTFTELNDKISSANDPNTAYLAQCRLYVQFDNFPNKAPREIVEDKEFLLSLIRHSGRFFPLVPRKLIDDKELVLAFLSSEPWEEYHMGCSRALMIWKKPQRDFRKYEDEWKSLYDDREFIKQAVKVCPAAYQLASERLRKEEEILNMALDHDVFNMAYVPKDAHVDKKTALEYVSRNGWGIDKLPSEYDSDLDVLLAAAENNPHSFRSASETARKNEELTIKLVKKGGVPYYEVDDSMWESPNFVLEMIRIFGLKVLKNISWSWEAFRDNYDFAGKMIKITPNGYALLPEKFQNDDRIREIMAEGEAKAFRKNAIKTGTEKVLDTRWDAFLHSLFVLKKMDPEEFRDLFFDTFWYFRQRDDVSVLSAGGWHILSCLSALKYVPRSFAPDGCTVNEFNAARCLCEDLLFEINGEMPGFYTEDRFVILCRCQPPAGCSPTGSLMGDHESFQRTFNEVVEEFDSCFEGWRNEYYSGTYNMEY